MTSEGGTSGPVSGRQELLGSAGSYTSVHFVVLGLDIVLYSVALYSLVKGGPGLSPLESHGRVQLTQDSEAWGWC